MRIAHSGAGIEPDAEAGGPLEVNVLFTSTRATMAATKVAGTLSDNLGARIRIIVPLVVPYPLPLSEPQIKPEFTANRIRAMLSQYPDVDVEVCLCREKVTAPISILEPHSLILIGGRTRFWPTEEYRIARGLRRRGHEVVFVEQPLYQ
jgi:hypothetical protein